MQSLPYLAGNMFFWTEWLDYSQGNTGRGLARRLYFCELCYLHKATTNSVVASSIVKDSPSTPTTPLWGMGPTVCEVAFVPLLTVHMNGAGPECPTS